MQLSPRAPDSVLVTGSVGYDDIETPHARDERILGGSASYIALAASYFALTRMVGVVGNDFAQADRDRLAAHGIDTEGLQEDGSGPTFRWSGKYHENYNRRETLDLRLNVFEHFQPHLPAAQRDSRFVILGNIHPELQTYVLDQLTSDEVFVAADTIDLWIETAREPLLHLLQRIHLLVVNDSEATLLTGEDNLVRAGETLRTMGPREVVVKKGEHGAYLFHPEGLFALPAYPVTELRDPTGAGDAFLGAMVGTLAALGDTSLTAQKLGLLYGTVVASLTVEAFSCDRLASGGHALIAERVEKLRAMTRLEPRVALGGAGG